MASRLPREAMLLPGRWKCHGRYNATMTGRVLVVEDEVELVRVLRDYLEGAGFLVDSAGDGAAGLSMFRHRQPDVVLLDLNLPGMDGLDVAREIRRSSDVPILMLTARVEEADRLIGLELGADDYIPKPFSPREVVARVRAVLRRTRREPEAPQLIRSADIEIDVARHVVTIGKRVIELTPTEFSLLLALAQQPGRVFTRMQLLEAVQGQAYEGYERTIDAHVKNLRSKIEPDPRDPRYVETVYGVGYRFRE